MPSARPSRIGILTGGGDCPGINAVIRAVAKTAIHRYDMEVCGVEDGYLGMVQNRVRRLSSADVSGILTIGGTILGTSNKDDPFAFAETVDGKLLRRDRSDEAIKNMKDQGLEALVCIGGDGTLTIAKKLSDKGLNVVGVPKTIDNDLSGTDLTFGYDSAVSIATEAVDRLHTTAQSHHRVMVCEVMGRYAGWLALGAGIAGGGDVILIPEIPFDLEKVCEAVIRRGREGKRFSIIVVAEGARPKGGQVVVKRTVADSQDPVRLGGIGNVIGSQVEELTGLETRVAVLGHLQRGGSPTPFDRILATRFGTKAADLVAAGQFGRMVSLKASEITSVPLAEAVGSLRLVPPGGALVASARAVGTSFGD